MKRMIRLLILASAALYSADATARTGITAGGVTGFWVDECYGYKETSAHKRFGDSTTGKGMAMSTDTVDATLYPNSAGNPILYQDAFLGTSATGDVELPVRKCRFTFEITSSSITIGAPGSTYGCLASTNLFSATYGGPLAAGQSTYSGYGDGSSTENNCTGCDLTATGTGLLVGPTDVSHPPLIADDADGNFGYNVKVQGSDETWAYDEYTDGIDGYAICGKILSSSGTDATNGITVTWEAVVGAVTDYRTFDEFNYDMMPVFQTGTEVLTPPAFVATSGSENGMYIRFQAMTAATFFDATGGVAYATAAATNFNVWGLTYTPMPYLDADGGQDSETYGYVSLTFTAGADIPSTSGDAYVVTGESATTGTGDYNYMANTLWTKVPRSQIDSGNAVTDTSDFTLEGIITKVDPDSGNLMFAICFGWGLDTVDGTTRNDPAKALGCEVLQAAETPIDDATMIANDGTYSSSTFNQGSSEIYVNGTPSPGIYLRADDETDEYSVIEPVGWVGPAATAPAATVGASSSARVSSSFITSKIDSNYGANYQAVRYTGQTGIADTDEDFTTYSLAGAASNFWSSSAKTFSATAPTANDMKQYKIYARKKPTSGDLGAFVDLTTGTYDALTISAFNSATSSSAVSKFVLWGSDADEPAFSTVTSDTSSVTTILSSGTAGWGSESSDGYSLVATGVSGETKYNQYDKVYLVDKRYTDNSVEGDCEKIEVLGDNVSYLPYLAASGTYGIQFDTGANPTDSNDMDVFGASAKRTIGGDIPPGTYVLYYQQYNAEVNGGYKFPAEQSQEITIEPAADVVDNQVLTVQGKDSGWSVAASATWELETWDGGAFATDGSEGLFGFTFTTTPATGDKIMVVPSGRGFSGPEEYEDLDEYNSGATYGCEATATTSNISFADCINYYGPTSYNVYYKSGLAGSQWVEQSGVSFTLGTDGGSKQYITGIRENASTAGLDTAYEYDDEDTGNGSTKGDALNGTPMGSYFPIKWNNFGDQILLADNTVEDASNSGGFSYKWDFKWGSETIFTGMSGTPLCALVEVDPETGATYAQGKVSGYSTGGYPWWYTTSIGGSTWSATTCSTSGSALNFGSNNLSVTNFVSKAGNTYQVAMKASNKDPWTLQSGAPITIQAINDLSTATLAADLAINPTAGVQVDSTGDSVDFTVTAGIDRFVFVQKDPSYFGPLSSVQWTGPSYTSFYSDEGLATATTFSVSDMVPGVYEVWGREAQKDYVKLTGVSDIKIEWEPPSSDAPVQAASGIKLICTGASASTCQYAATVEKSNPTSSAYQLETNPFGVSQAQYETLAFNMVDIKLNFADNLSTSKDYSIYFAAVDTSADTNFYSTPASDATTAEALDTQTDNPGSAVGLSRSPCDAVGRQTSTAVTFLKGTASSTNQQKTSAAGQSDLTADWNFRKFTAEANYDATRSTAADNAKLGFLQVGADDCQNASGLEETWVFPELASGVYQQDYQACFQTGNESGVRIYMSGDAPAANEADARTYIKVRISRPQPAVTSPATGFNMWVGAVLSVLIAMLM